MFLLRNLSVVTLPHLLILFPSGFSSFNTVCQEIKALLRAELLEVNNDSTWRLSVCWKEEKKTCAETVEYLAVYYHDCFDKPSVQKTKTVREIIYDNTYLNYYL